MTLLITLGFAEFTTLNNDVRSMGRAVIRMTNPGVGFPCSTKRDGELIGLPRE